MHHLFDIAKDAVITAGFVLVMMLVIEYVNVLTRGAWDRGLRGLRWLQPAVCALLGVTPGCLGSFVVVSLYMHRVVTFGALLAAAVATCGDEAFLMLALFPGKALRLFGALAATGVVSGMVVDALLKRRVTARDVHASDYRSLHDDEDECITFSRAVVLRQWRRCTAHRGWLTLLLVLFAVGIAGGELAHEEHAFAGIGADPAVATVPADAVGSAAGAGSAVAEPGAHGWGWMRITLLLTTLTGLFIVASVPDHFLEEHLWNHLVKTHAWRILLWTLGAMVAIHLVTERLDLSEWIRRSGPTVLVMALLVGLIPQSGPHVIFVTLYAAGTIPLSVLAANSIVQDGHGMLPMLAHSKRAFAAVKAVKLAIGLAVGVLGQFMGW